jgi:hypothetical protein
VLGVIVESFDSTDTLSSSEAFALVLDLVVLVFRESFGHDT